MVYAPISISHKFPDMTSTRRRNILIALACLLLITTLYYLDLGHAIPATSTSTPIIFPVVHASASTSTSHTWTPREYTQTLVVASTRKEDTSWVAHELPNINHAIYVADDPKAPLHPPKNRGHESMIYLTYIIDHYHNLSDTTIFTHAEKNGWHNNDLFDFDLAKMISHVSNEHVERVGYFNLRCHHESGCPDHIKPQSPGKEKLEEVYFAQVWEALHGPDAPPLPETLAVPCCSQFAVSRAAIQKIPLERWEHYQQWLLKAPLPDSISGRIWEFTWHYILTGQDVVCPPIEQCYCDGFGLCFHDEGEITSWLAMKEVQLLATHLRDNYVGNAEKDKQKEDVQYHLDQRIGRPLKKWLYEAELRGKDPYVRAVLSGRGDSWREGDGY